MSKIVSVRKVANGSLQAEMVGKVAREGRVNVLAELNKGDDRFNTGNDRRAWFPVTIMSLGELGVSAADLQKVSDMEQGTKFALEIESPKINGEELCIQVNETIIPDAYQKENVMKTAKLIAIDARVAANKSIKTSFNLSQYEGEKGYFLDTNGNHIFSRTSVTVKSQLKHTFIDAELVPESELASFGATLAEPVSAEQFANA